MLGLIPTNTNKIIVAPLNWGLGHATRSIPIIKTLLASKKEVIIASDNEALDYLKNEFPQLQFEILPSYKVKYTQGNLYGTFIKNIPNIIRAIRKETKVMQQLVFKHKPDLIISDSRFGCYSKSVKNVIVSHQLSLVHKNGFASYFGTLFNTYLLNKFDSCWIPDLATHAYSGLLSKNDKIKNAEFLGLLSRLQKKEQKKEIDVSIVLSGPEPARTKLEQALIKQLHQSRFNICLVRGSQHLAPLKLDTKWSIIERANSVQLSSILNTSKLVVSRSGYSSIMDYIHLDLPAILIPTPGQPEQEYLASYLNNKYNFKKLENIDMLSEEFIAKHIKSTLS